MAFVPNALIKFFINSFAHKALCRFRDMCRKIPGSLWEERQQVPPRLRVLLLLLLTCMPSSVVLTGLVSSCTLMSHICILQTQPHVYDPFRARVAAYLASPAAAQALWTPEIVSMVGQLPVRDIKQEQAEALERRGRLEAWRREQAAAGAKAAAVPPPPSLFTKPSGEEDAFAKEWRQATEAHAQGKSPPPDPGSSSPQASLFMLPEKPAQAAARPTIFVPKEQHHKADAELADDWVQATQQANSKASSAAAAP